MIIVFFTVLVAIIISPSFLFTFPALVFDKKDFSHVLHVTRRLTWTVKTLGTSPLESSVFYWSVGTGYRRCRPYSHVFVLSNIDMFCGHSLSPLHKPHGNTVCVVAVATPLRYLGKIYSDVFWFYVKT